MGKLINNYEKIDAKAGWIGAKAMGVGHPFEKSSQQRETQCSQVAEIKIVKMIKVKPFRQTAGFCGPSSLRMVLDYYGVSVTEAALAKAAGASRKSGASKEGLVKAARQFGFKVFSKEKSTFNDLRRFLKKGIPVIVDWFFEDDGHYSVVVDISREKIILADPSLGGIRKMSLEKFIRLWFDFPGKAIREPKDLVLRLMIVVAPSGLINAS